MSSPLTGTSSAANSIARISYTHDAMIDLIIANPAMSQGELAGKFGYTPAWVSQVMNSDAFQARLAERKKDIIDPSLVLSVEEKLKAVTSKSLDVVLQKLQNPGVSVETALKGVELGTKALGYGARQQAPVVNNNFVVALPPKSATAEEWQKAFSPPKADILPSAVGIED